MGVIREAQEMGEGPCLKLAEWETYWGNPPTAKVETINHPDPFVQSDIEEAARIRWLLDTGEYDSPDFLETDGDIPYPSTLFSIFHLAPKYNITLIGEKESASGDNGHRRFQSVVLCWRPSIQRTSRGAAQSKDKEVSQFLAWKNSIRSLLTTEELIYEYEVRREA